MRDLGQVLARDAHQVCAIEKAGGDDDVARPMLVLVGRHPEIATLAADVEDALVQPDVERLALGDAAVVLHRVFARRLVALDRKRITADLDQIRRQKNSICAG